MQSPIARFPFGGARLISAPPPVARAFGFSETITGVALQVSSATISSFALLVQTIAHGRSTLCHAAPEQAPTFERGESLIEAVTDWGMASGRAKVLDGL
jgi:hypothetical protein